MTDKKTDKKAAAPKGAAAKDKAAAASKTKAAPQKAAGKKVPAKKPVEKVFKKSLNKKVKKPKVAQKPGELNKRQKLRMRRNHIKMHLRSRKHALKRAIRKQVLKGKKISRTLNFKKPKTRKIIMKPRFAKIHDQTGAEKKIQVRGKETKVVKPMEKVPKRQYDHSGGLYTNVSRDLIHNLTKRFCCYTRRQKGLKNDLSSDPMNPKGLMTRRHNGLAATRAANIRLTRNGNTVVSYKDPKVSRFPARSVKTFRLDDDHYTANRQVKIFCERYRRDLRKPLLRRLTAIRRLDGKYNKNFKGVRKELIQVHEDKRKGRNQMRKRKVAKSLMMY